MIREVTFEKTTYNELPFKFEAGTPNIADVIGMGAALDYFNSLDRAEVETYEHQLLELGTQLIQEFPEVQLIGTAKHKAAVISFLVKGTHPSDVGTLLDQFGVAVRTGHHCCQPVMKRLGIPGTVRVSLSFYNTEEEIHSMAGYLKKVISMLT